MLRTSETDTNPGDTPGFFVYAQHGHLLGGESPLAGKMV